MACSPTKERKPAAIDAGAPASVVRPAPPQAPPASIGIATCDRFARAWLACAAALPEADGAAAREAIDRMLVAWKKTVADDPGAREAIERTCLATLEAERKATGARCPGVSWSDP